MDRALIRAALIEAGQCLAEALRFYESDSDVPPASAFFAARSLERFREHPELFARQQLVELAAALPPFYKTSVKSDSIFVEKA